MRALAYRARRPAREDEGDGKGPEVGASVRHSLSTELAAAAPDALALRRLAGKLARYAPHDGVFPLRLPGTYALRVGRMTSEPVYATLRPSLCVVAQGAKILMLGSEVLNYDAARMLVLAVDLPVAGQVTRASSREPYLGFKLDLDAGRVAELAARAMSHEACVADARGGPGRRGLAVCSVRPAVGRPPARDVCRSGIAAVNHSHVGSTLNSSHTILNSDGREPPAFIMVGGL